MREWRFLMQPHANSDDSFEIRQRPADGHKSLHARAAFAPGQTLVRFSARATLAEPAVHTVQTGPSEHVLLEPGFLEFTNHSCAPNVVFDVERMEVRAVELIQPGDEIVYFYPSTEAYMSQPFRCHCNAERCLGLIEGAGYLSPEVLERYYLAHHIRTHLLRPAASYSL